MNKIKIILLLLSLVFVFNSCKKSDDRLKEEIIGGWSYSATEEDEEDNISTTVSAEGLTSFNADGTILDNSVVLMTCIDEFGDESFIKYEVEMQGKYNIQESYLTYSYDSESINLDLLETNNYEFSELFLEYFLSLLKEEMSIEERSKILSLSKKQMILEGESDGVKETMIYTRQLSK
ncbi:hypothetical protein LJB98_03660 [Bacteroidales bacterium OttesenSCG-928-M11]|nr:hypothetical protein [Bacteroidales bacterium OttesenSCG-928-M11]